MYNEDLKIRYLDTLKRESDQIALSRIFNHFAPYEEQVGADLSAMPPEKVYEILREIAPSGKQSQNKYIYLLKYYCDWCMENKIPGAKCVLTTKGVDISNTETIREKMVSGPAHLQQILDEIFDLEDMMTSDNIIRCYFWMAFMGFVNADEAGKVSARSINFKERILSYRGDQYPIYEESLRAMRNAARRNSFFTSRYGPGGELVDRLPGNALLRWINKQGNTKTKDGQKNGIANTVISRVKNAVSSGLCDVRITYTSVYRSGIFYRMHEMEKEGFPVDFLPDIMRDEKFRDKDKKPRQKTWYKQEEKKYQAEYQNWKKAFDL